MPTYKDKIEVVPPEQEYVVIRILGGKDKSGKDIIKGGIRVKPSSIMWKPKGEKYYFTVPLEQFWSWIVDPKTGAKRTLS